MVNFLIYGSYGYTGELIVELAVKLGLKPLLAGRDKVRLKKQAQKYGLDYRAFDLNNSIALDSALREVDVVLHCAGPFSLSLQMMIEACIRTRRHYVDISGEIEGFEILASMDQQAKRSGIMILPGVGFDVVPSDCLSAHIKKRLPDATHLRLFIHGVGAGVSRGTAKSAIENMHRQGRIRKNGKIVQVPAAWKIQKVDFGSGLVDTVSVGWGDVSTAFHSTGIPNIETYMYFSRGMVNLMRAVGRIGFLLNSRHMKNILKRSIDVFLPVGPSLINRQKGMAIMIAEGANDQGEIVRSKLTMPEAYSLTAFTALEIVKRVGAAPEPGFYTPSRFFGSDFILQFPGVERVDL